MAQHDYDIANQNGAAFRADLNNALEAIQSSNSGSTEPASTIAYMPWADTNAGLWKVRNAANSAWVSVFSLTASRVDTASGTSYDNASSGLSATNVKDAIDEIVTTGAFEKATTDQAETGTNDTAFMTPLKTAQAISATVTMSDVRQTVNSGPVDANGRADFIDAGTGLQAVTTGLPTTPLNVTAGDGFNAQGKVDWVLEIDENLTWNSLADDDVNYLAIDLSDGSTISTTLTPDYSPVKPSSPSSGQIWYPLIDHHTRAEQWDGATWQPKLLVLVGQATTSSGSVVSAVSYAYQGKYVSSPQTVPGSGGTVSLNHNIGIPGNLLDGDMAALCVTGDGAWSTGEYVHQVFATTSGSLNGGKGPSINTPTQLTFKAGDSSAAVQILRKSTGATYNVGGNSNWRLVFSAWRTS